jgi:tRNA pseudouridine(38-40) synthase
MAAHATGNEIPAGGAAGAAAAEWWASVRDRAQRYALIIEYIGTDYHGSQSQGEGDSPAKLSVQDDLEAALRKLVPHAPRAPVAVLSGRTDAGVHATGGVMHVDLARCDRAGELHTPYTPDVLLKSLSHSLPKCRLGVVAACCVPSTFHAQRSARMRTYIYRIKCGSTHNAADVPLVRRAVCCTGLWQVSAAA